jgi:hypothetical protein
LTKDEKRWNPKKKGVAEAHPSLLPGTRKQVLDTEGQPIPKTNSFIDPLHDGRVLEDRTPTPASLDRAAAWAAVAEAEAEAEAELARAPAPEAITRRIGRFRIPQALLQPHMHHSALAVYRDMVVLRCEANFVDDTLMVWAESELFEVAEPGQVIPEYSAVVVAPKQMAPRSHRDLVVQWSLMQTSSGQSAPEGETIQ